MIDFQEHGVSALFQAQFLLSAVSASAALWQDAAPTKAKGKLVLYLVLGNSNQQDCSSGISFVALSKSRAEALKKIFCLSAASLNLLA